MTVSAARPRNDGSGRQRHRHCLNKKKRWSLMQCSMNTAVGREDGAQVEGCAHTRVLRRRRPRERAPAPRRTPPRENTARCAQRPSDSNIPRAKAYPVTAPPLYRCTPRSPTSRHSSKERRCLRVKVRTNNRRAPQRFVTTDVPRCQRTPAERLRALRARGMQQRKRCARVQACADSKKSRGVWLSQWLLDGYSEGACRRRLNKPAIYSYHWQAAATSAYTR